MRFSIYAIGTTLLIALSSLGCGSKTTLSVNPPRDSGVPPRDSEPDARDAEPDVPPRMDLTVDCPRRDQYTTVLLPIAFSATVDSTSPITRSGWTLTSAPAGSTSTNMPESGLSTAITPDAVGDYLLTLRVENAEGLGGSCEVVVHSIVGPPVAICPEEPLTTMINEPLEVVGDAFDDVGVVSQEWRLESGPGRAVLDPVDTLVTTFFAREPGDYVVSLTVIDTEMATDTCTVPIRVTAPPRVFCPMSPIMTPTRQPLDITARAEDDTRRLTVAWELVNRPDMSATTLDPTDAMTTRMTPDRQGRYRVRFTATDSDGLTASCEVEVIGTPTPPECMDTIVDTTPLTETTITANGVDDGTILGWRWTLTRLQEGSAARAPRPANEMTTFFTPDIVGEYLLGLQIVDDDRETATCQYTVRAVATEGLRIEINWDTNGTDMDTHLLRPLPEGTSWFNDNDCYYANCNDESGAVLEWGNPGLEDNPRLDLDDTGGFGPENINVDEPQPGIYRVGVHAFRGNGRVTVRIYCGGSTTMPRQSFGPTLLRGSGGPRPNDFWRVADVEVTAAGTCRITELLSPAGRPDIQGDEDARARR
ncbi:MAG: hypothetical protein JRH11_15060 [Deltaproteobacteria bacterium]|nr:hypothetical protein [Deltaproteobacteria bacterium]